MNKDGPHLIKQLKKSPQLINHSNFSSPGGRFNRGRIAKFMDQGMGFWEIRLTNVLVILTVCATQFKVAQ
jgi:hypothetical protein